MNVFLRFLEANQIWFEILAILIVTIILTRFIRWSINRYVSVASEKLKIDKTNYKFFNNAVSLVIWTIALAVIVSLVPKLKSLAITIFAGAGILFAIIGFAAQEAFSNIVGGVFIVFFKPFRVGDLIRVGTFNYGVVEDITLRHTIILNFEHKRIVIPNSVINRETIINDTIEDKKVCRWIEVGISYDSDVHKAMKILQEECEKHPNVIDGRTAKEKRSGFPVVNVRHVGFGDSSINLRAFAWVADPMLAWQVNSEVNIAIKKRFDLEGIEIPFPHRTIVYKK